MYVCMYACVYVCVYVEYADLGKFNKLIFKNIGINYKYIIYYFFKIKYYFNVFIY